MNRRIDKALATELALVVRRAGGSLRQAAEAAGIHVATLCRWKRSDPAFRLKLNKAAPQVRGKPQFLIALQSDGEQSVQNAGVGLLCEALQELQSSGAAKTGQIAPGRVGDHEH